MKIIKKLFVKKIRWSLILIFFIFVTGCSTCLALFPQTNKIIVVEKKITPSKDKKIAVIFQGEAYLTPNGITLTSSYTAVRRKQLIKKQKEIIKKKLEKNGISAYQLIDDDSEVTSNNNFDYIMRIKLENWSFSQDRDNMHFFVSLLITMTDKKTDNVLIKLTGSANDMTDPFIEVAKIVVSAKNRSPLYDNIPEIVGNLFEKMLQKIFPEK